MTNDVTYYFSAVSTAINLSATNPHLVALLYADNATSEAWIIRSSDASLAIRALDHI